MAVINVSDEFYTRMKLAAEKAHRSVPKQIEYMVEVAEARQKPSVAEKMQRFEHTLEKFDDAFKVLSK